MMRDPDSSTAILRQLYGADAAALARQIERRDRLFEEHRCRFGPTALRWFSAPGRTEIGGNHTDHNRGKVLAAAVNLDSIAAVAASPDDQITIHSEGYTAPFVVACGDVAAVPAERGTTAALIRGIVSRFRQLEYAVGGFQACITSDVPVGSGLSSSASVEMLLATILNALYNEGRLDCVQIARIGQYAENIYFGKPSGLMDQITSAVGGVAKIDFENPESPLVERIDFDFAAAGISLLVVDTGGSHADLTEDYASIPKEMKMIAANLGRKFCREVSEQDLFGSLAALRTSAGDRAILRALHFLQENQRVDLQVEALRRQDMPGFLQLIVESGSSSYRWLQNCINTREEREQGIPLALALTEKFVRRWGGACRVHGGGFAGTILVFIPTAHIGAFQGMMEPVFGTGCVKVLRVRSKGSMEVPGLTGQLAR